MLRLLKDPLTIFLLFGALLFGIAEFGLSADVAREVHVSTGHQQRLAEQWAMQMRRPPTDAELKGLIEQYVREEIYYREAQRLGLDQDDTIVRRRMVQKLTFRTEDIATAEPLSEDALRAYYDEHVEDYRLPTRYTFEHAYFSSDRRTTAQADAEQFVSDPAMSSDPFMLQKFYQLRSEREIGDLFGREFAQTLTELQPNDRWQGPIQSAYGWHPVKVVAIVPSAIQPFAEVRDRVLADARQSTRDAANEAFYADLRNRYTVTIEAPQE